MDPISAAIAVMILSAVIAKGVDVATDGLVRAEVGGGVRGAGRYLIQAERGRWRRSRAAARRARMQTRTGRVVQAFLDEFAVLGKGVVRGWRSGRTAAKRARTARRGDSPMPVEQWWERVAARLPGSGRCRWTVSPVWQSWFGVQTPCGRLATHGKFCSEHAAEASRTPCVRCGRPLGSNPNCIECGRAGVGPNVADPNAAPGSAWWNRNGDPEPDRNEHPNEAAPDGEPDPEPGADELGPLPPTCPDCGMPIVLPNGLNDHRLGRDRCPYADQNEDPTQEDAIDPNDQPAERSRWATEDMTPCPDHGRSKFDASGRCMPSCGFGWETDPLTLIRDNTHLIGTGAPMPDITSAPAAIAAFGAFRGRFEEPESLLTALRDEIASTADSMGDFAIGGEGDLTAGFQAALDALVGAKEQVDAYLSALHLEYDASIEAAESKQAGAHRPMQEV